MAIEVFERNHVDDAYELPLMVVNAAREASAATAVAARTFHLQRLRQLIDGRRRKPLRGVIEALACARDH